MPDSPVAAGSDVPAAPSQAPGAAAFGGESPGLGTPKGYSEASGAPGESARDPTLAGCAASGEAPEVPATAAEVKNRGVHPRDAGVQLRYGAAGDTRSAASSSASAHSASGPAAGGS